MTKVEPPRRKGLDFTHCGHQRIPLDVSHGRGLQKLALVQ